MDTIFNLYLNGVSLDMWFLTVNHCYDFALQSGYLVSEIACIMETSL